MPNTNVRRTVFRSVRPLDPTATCVMVSVIDPEKGGIYCADGKDVLPVGADIWTDPEEEPPRPNAGWSVYYVKDKNTEPRLLDVHDWRPVGFDVSKPCVTCGTIYAKVDSIPYFCSRALTVIKKDESGGKLPVIVTQSIPNGFVDHVYTADLKVTGTAPITWSSRFSLPDGLTLNDKTGQISGTPTVVGEYTVSIYARNIYGSVVKQYPLIIHDSSTLDVEVHVHEYFVGNRIGSDDLTVRYLGQEVKMGDYCLMYDMHRSGDQSVTVLYVNKEGTSLATASYKVIFHHADDFISNPIYFGFNESVKRAIHEYISITNSNNLAENLAKKQEILRTLALDFERRESKLKKTSEGRKLAKNLGFLFNEKLNIRHPNTEGPEGEELLKWCDTTFRLYLTAALLSDYDSELQEKITKLNPQARD